MIILMSDIIISKGSKIIAKSSAVILDVNSITLIFELNLMKNKFYYLAGDGYHN